MFHNCTEEDKIIEENDETSIRSRIRVIQEFPLPRIIAIRYQRTYIWPVLLGGKGCRYINGPINSYQRTL